MNETMKVLTVFASIFIPLTFIAGGVNGACIQLNAIDQETAQIENSAGPAKSRSY
jgi:hypothetical protein